MHKESVNSKSHSKCASTEDENSTDRKKQKLCSSEELQDKHAVSTRDFNTNCEQKY